MMSLVGKGDTHQCHAYTTCVPHVYQDICYTYQKLTIIHCKISDSPYSFVQKDDNLHASSYT